MPQSRQLAAIMFTDIVGYTALMQANEHTAVAVIKHYNSALEKWVGHFNGQVLNYYGDGSLCIFSSATDAVNCSLAIQTELKTEPVVPLRIGLHIGEVFFEDAKALGDGVNVASRVQSLGQQNTILISGEVHDKIKNNPSFTSRSLGHFEFKNVGKSMEVFALTNEGLSVPQRKTMSGKLKKKNLLTRNIVFASILVLLLASYFVYKNFSAEKQQVASKSIAVLPFVDMSAGKDQEYFSDGLSEELINLLAKIPELKVIGRTSSFSFKGKNEDLRNIAQKLGVAHILEGSVRKDGNKIRITAQLIRADDGSHLWSEKYERDLEGLFKLQDEIAASVVKELELKFLTVGSGAGASTNIEVHNLVLQGNYFFDKLDKENVAKAVDFYNRAIAIDSTDARAWGKLANAISRQVWQKYIDSKGNSIRVKLAAARAIELNKNLAIGYAELGDYYLYHEYNWSDAEENYKKALTLEPENPDALYGLAGSLKFSTGQWDESIELMKKCIELEPLRPLYHMNLGNILTHSGKPAEAIPYFKKALELDPHFQRAHMYIGRNYLLLGQKDSALKEMQQENFEVFRVFGSSLAYHALGQKPKADETLNQFIIKYHDEWNYLLAELYAFRGEKDQAFFYLEKAYEHKDQWLVSLKGDPLLKNLENDDRYKLFLKKMNLPLN